VILITKFFSKKFRELKETYFFGYLPLKWRRLTKTFLMSPLFILLIIITINFFTIQIWGSYGKTGRSSVPFYGNDEIYNEWIVLENGQRTQLMYPDGDCGFCLNKIKSFFYHYDIFEQDSYNYPRKIIFQEGYFIFSSFTLLQLSIIYFLLINFISWSFSAKGLGCKYSPIGFIVWLIEPFKNSK